MMRTTRHQPSLDRSQLIRGAARGGMRGGGALVLRTGGDLGCGPVVLRACDGFRLRSEDALRVMKFLAQRGQFATESCVLGGEPGSVGLKPVFAGTQRRYVAFKNLLGVLQLNYTASHRLT
jgi:hypothetical protein